MRVNIYAEEMSDRVELIEKTTADGTFTGIRFWLYLPVTDEDGYQRSGKFMHRPGDDDSAAVTFWGKRELKAALRKALDLLESHERKAPDYWCPVCPHPRNLHNPDGTCGCGSDCRKPEASP